ncbi:sorting nexin-6 [Puma concolor]|uniref:Sorting nexin-6 n=2 Tax=Laurasiatheria TaxID=314145 RepID=A0A6P6HI31_PUMCO|nr:sorting nexin-6 [Puma concolor]
MALEKEKLCKGPANSSLPPISVRHCDERSAGQGREKGGRQRVGGPQEGAARRSENGFSQPLSVEGEGTEGSSSGLHLHFPTCPDPSALGERELDSSPGGIGLLPGQSRPAETCQQPCGSGPLGPFRLGCFDLGRRALPSFFLPLMAPGPRLQGGAERALKAINVDLQSDAALQVDISDALSERDKVKFTVHTKSSLPNFKQNEFSVVRQHEEFIWLHDSFVENEDYAGYIIPPAPPRPDFDASREKLQKLGEGEGSMTKEEFTKMKQELEAEYLAIFKKTVAMHEVFLCRVAAHPILRKDLNFHVFLEYNQDLSVRGKNKKEKLEDFFKNMVKSADGVIVSGVKDVDDFFEHERTFLLEYHNRVKDASAKSDRMTRSHKSAADDYNRIGSSLYALGTQDSTDICKFFLKVSELFDKTRKIEARVSADEDLKLSDLLKYYLRESQAAKENQDKVKPLCSSVRGPSCIGTAEEKEQVESEHTDGLFFANPDNQGKARTQSPTTTNYAVEFPTFGEIAGVSTSGVQWISLALGKPPS